MYYLQKKQLNSVTCSRVLYPAVEYGASQLQDVPANTYRACRDQLQIQKQAANTEASCKYRSKLQIQKQAANTEASCKYRSKLQIQDVPIYWHDQRHWHELASARPAA
jgi:hypothetical protein